MATNRADRPWLDLPPEVPRAIEPELPALVDDIIGALRDGVPAYQRPLEGEFGRGLRAGVEQALRHFVDEMAGGERPRDRAIYVALGRGEHRAGRSLDALL